MMNTCYVVASSDIVFENFGGDLVVLDIATGRYFGFNSTAARVWEALMSGVSPGSIAALGFDAAALGGFVGQLAGYELIVPATHSGKPLPDQLHSALAADLSAPTVEMYEDLADLIVADPIHDADEQQGWPRMAKAA
jgi:coenzyme PQQ synthesis protein D (PqqD)